MSTFSISKFGIHLLGEPEMGSRIASDSRGKKKKRTNYPPKTREEVWHSITIRPHSACLETYENRHATKIKTRNKRSSELLEASSDQYRLRRETAKNTLVLHLVKGTERLNETYLQRATLLNPQDSKAVQKEMCRHPEATDLC